MKQFLITTFLLLVLVDAASSRYYRWFRWHRSSRNLLRRCNRQSILDKLCPVSVDQCAGVDCNCNGQCNSEDGTCNCFEGFTGDSCEIEDICTIENFCKNGANCTNNQCQCTGDFAGETCEICNNFVSTDENQIVAEQFEISVPTFETVLSCAGRCVLFENCTAYINQDGGGCVFFGEPVLDVIDLGLNSTPDECGIICLNTDGCISAYTLTRTCNLLTEANVELQTSVFGGSGIDRFERQCNL